MPLVDEIQQHLRYLNSYDRLLKLLETLGFEYSGEPQSLSEWPSGIRQAVTDFRKAAYHGSFGIFFVEIPEDHMLGWERQITERLLRAEPHSILVFTNKQHSLWHFVHVRWDERVELRRQLRRFVVDLREPEIAKRLRTTSERLSHIAITHGEKLSALELQHRCDNAFRIAEVTKRFLAAFVKVVSDLTECLLKYNTSLLTSEADALRQAQLLMDRLVFLYFVQKKGWLNQEQDYLYRRFRVNFEAKRTEDTFYREHLLNLFRALSHRNAIRPRDEKGEDEAIPFLNGGLFDLPLSSGSANPPMDERISVPNDILYPIFEDFLERYNFTTTEDTPLDVEVAINPEVIGTIFETFVLTSENQPQDNAPDRRKATGSYYTPRCVVHFICRAVFRRYLSEQTGIEETVVKQLIEFIPAEQLNTDQEAELQRLFSIKQAEQLRRAALSVRACDPAVGSGAFLVGLLQEMVKLIALLDLRIGGHPVVDHRNYAYELKKEIIEDCLYGVDIQEQAVQICELRLWLSLVIDYQIEAKLPLKERIKHIEPLPNLTFRVRVGDSLLDQIFEHDYNFGVIEHDELIGKIKAAKQLYYKSETPEGKRDLETQIFRYQLELLEHLLKDAYDKASITDPMLAGLLTHRQILQQELSRLKRLEIEEYLNDCRLAREEASQPINDISEYVRRFDAIRKKFKISFVWKLDFAEVFDPDVRNRQERKPGFDIIVGNPPFVTARNPEKREKYRKQWPTSCFKKYHMLSPFIELALMKLLRPNGQLGFIVSNAFATRDFGKPLIEETFQRIELLNVIDCSGLMFPGHGTPTSILLGHAISSKPKTPTILCGTKTGMGQLREEAEETALWNEIETDWEQKVFKGNRISVVEWSTGIARSHPWSLNATGLELIERIKNNNHCLIDFLEDNIGYATVIGSEFVFISLADLFRRLGTNNKYIRYFLTGEESRDWSITPSIVVLSPYDEQWNLVSIEDLPKAEKLYLSHFKKHLENRLDFGSKTYLQAGRPYWCHHQVTKEKYNTTNPITFAFVATHIHAIKPNRAFTLNRSCNLASVNGNKISFHVALTLLNSSTALFLMRQICFCKRESDNPETDNYYEFAGGKIEQLPIPLILISNDIVKFKSNQLSDACSKLGELLPGLHPNKIFEFSGEAYTDWYRNIPGYQPPSGKLNLNWQSASELKSTWNKTKNEIKDIQKQMVAFQEEMDWLIYGAYGLLPLEHSAINLTKTLELLPIDQLERPYRLVQNDLSIPSEWPEKQRNLWQARLRVIQDNELIAQLEQPSYKRRWELPFGDRDFIYAYEWWLREKAEWLLENQFKGEPIDLETWSETLWIDIRIQAAFEVAMEIGISMGNPDYMHDKSHGLFSRHLKRIIDEETVPDRRDAFKKKHEKLRGIDSEKHLPNGIPRERFRSISSKDGWYIWAGINIWGGVAGDKWDA